MNEEKDGEKVHEFIEISEVLYDEVHIFCDNFCRKHNLNGTSAIFQIAKLIIVNHLSSQDSVEKRNSVAKLWKGEIDEMVYYLQQEDEDDE